jgi:dUTP pyrophosphatase
MLEINIKKLHENAIIPSYAKDGDAGMDLTAITSEVDEFGNHMYRTGLSIEIPEAYVGLIFPRSSISKFCLDLANSVGVIDSGYRGEIICKFKPTPQASYSDIGIQTEYNIKYQIGERIAQIIIIPIPQVLFKEVKELGKTERGKGGFGSSGK